MIKNNAILITGDKMERTLSLVLDEEGFVSLTLMQDEAVKIDEFTTKKFEDSEQIREHFKNQIDNYLEENKRYVEAISKGRGKNFRGRIVILEPHEHDGSLYFIEKRVLYKKNLVAFKEMIKDKPTMQRFLQLERIGFNQYGFRKLISPFLTREIKYTNYQVKSRVDFLRREIKRNKNNFYDILRIISKAYETERRNRPYLKTIEAIYKESKPKPNIENVTQDNFPEKEFYTIDGVSYPVDEIPFDLDELRYMETDYLPDGLGDIHEKRKS